MPGRTIAIGDIHGCAYAFQGLLKLLQLSRDDTLVVLGDCIDRGPGSKQVIETLLQLEDACQVVNLLGNHEEMLLAAVDRPNTSMLWQNVGGRETLQSYGVEQADQLPRDHLLYFRTWRDYWETDTHFYAHGCYDPAVPLENQEWGYQRWQSIRDQIPAPHISGKTAVVGHTAQKRGEVFYGGNLICIDTNACGGKWLTAYDAKAKKVWQVDPQGQPRR